MKDVNVRDLIRRRLRGKEAVPEDDGQRFLSPSELEALRCTWPRPIQQHAVLLARMLRPYRAVGFDKIRVGGGEDGGYVMLDDFAGVDTAFSLGVGPNVDWDHEMAERGLTVHQFDHTVDGPPRAHERFRFNKRGIRPVADAEAESVGSILRHATSAAPASSLLKIDIEGHEWAAFAQADPADLRRYAQILVELHAFEYLHEPAHADNTLAALQKLKAFFEVVHIHANNVADATVINGVVLPFVMEVTLVNRERYDTCPSVETFPTPLDRTNDLSRPDYRLGRFDI